MDKKLIIAAAVVVILVAAAFLVLQQPTGGQQAGNATLAHVDELHMGMNASSLDELEAVIRGSGDNYTRERAVSDYADIALQTGNGERALAFLKAVAYDEANDDVRTSAYSNYYLLQDELGKKPETSLDVKVLGDIKPGNNITVVLTILSTRGSNTSSVVLWPSELQDRNYSLGGGNFVDVNTGKGAFAQAEVTPSTRLRTYIPANISMEMPYTVYLKGAGQTILKAMVEVRYDRLDYDWVEKDIFLDVGPSGGNYTIME